jgi:phage terminase large subunit
MAGQAAEVLAPKVRDLFLDSSGNYIPSDYKVMHGGRGGLKSWGFASMAVLLGVKRKLRIACAREYQTSISESVHEVIAGQIERLGLSRYFDVGKTAISGYNGTRFFFAGIKTNPGKFKSTEGIDILWIEEGEKVSADSWEKVVPTVRKAGSEIWCAFNPDLETDPTSQRFIVDPIPNARIVQTSWRDNPWLSERIHREREYLLRVDPDAYAHVWDGEFRRNSEAQVLKGKYSVEAFEPQSDWSGPYYGADWGFSTDPTALVKLWIKDRVLYVEHEAYGIGVEINHLPTMFEAVPAAKTHVIRADNARPETISYLKHHGYPRITAAFKGPGSVEDGVEHLRSYEKIVINPRCEHTVLEARLWSYKVDKLTGDVLPELVDKHNHCWDAARYALEPLIKRRTSKVTPLRM